MTFPQVVTPECFNRGSTMLTTTLSHVEWVGVQSEIHLDFRRRTDPSEALWRTRSKHAGMTDFAKVQLLRSNLREIQPT